VLQIRDVYPGSRIQIFSILDPTTKKGGEKCCSALFTFFVAKISANKKLFYFLRGTKNFELIGKELNDF
jgi:hypothetical protein